MEICIPGLIRPTAFCVTATASKMNTLRNNAIATTIKTPTVSFAFAPKCLTTMVNAMCVRTLKPYAALNMASHISRKRAASSDQESETWKT